MAPDGTGVGVIMATYLLSLVQQLYTLDSFEPYLEQQLVLKLLIDAAVVQSRNPAFVQLPEKQGGQKGVQGSMYGVLSEVMEHEKVWIEGELNDRA